TPRPGVGDGLPDPRRRRPGRGGLGDRPRRHPPVQTGLGLAEGRPQRRAILGRMLRAEEEERSRIATALHDDTVQVMTASLMAMDRVALVARRHDNDDVESALMYARSTLEEATERTRRLMFELRPAMLHDHGLAAALRLLV